MNLDTQHSNSTSIQDKIKQCRSNNKTNTEYTNLKVYSKVMIKSEGYITDKHRLHKSEGITVK